MVELIAELDRLEYRYDHMYNQDSVDKLCELVNLFEYRVEKIEKKIEKQTQENDYMHNRVNKEK